MNNPGQKSELVIWIAVILLISLVTAGLLAAFLIPA
jgi:hypothetical protein